VHFKRPELALSFAKELLGSSMLSDAPNGLFLAAARRTGKTEFLKQDLRPALEDLGVLVAYVDLWADKTRPPMELIARALAQVMQQGMGLVAQAVKGTGLDSISVAGFKIEISKIGKTDGMTLHEVLALIHKQTGKKIALIIDEAQHALTSAEGDATMSALKSARDQMRDADGPALLLVISGSHRDKLMRLLSTAAAPFWGSQVRALPTLGQPFVEQVAQELKLQTSAALNIQTLMQAFTLCGERPQFFFEAIREALQDKESYAPLEQRVLKVAEQRRQRDRDGMSAVYLALPVLEQVVLWRLLEKGENFKPFDAAALAFYSEQAGKSITAAQAQKAIDRLRDNDPPLVWRSLRGEYSLYDVDMLDWHVHLAAQKAWPPKAKTAEIPRG
jgi:hypothetical protein